MTVLVVMLPVDPSAAASVDAVVALDGLCDTGSGSSVDGRVTNRTDAPLAAVFAGPERVVVGGRLEQGADPLAVVLEPGEQVVTLVGVAAGDVVSLLVDGAPVEEVEVGDCRADVTLIAGVDADLDGVYGRDEAGPAPAGPVVLEALVTNLGLPAAIELATSAGGESRVVFGRAVTEPSARCAFAGADHDEPRPLVPGQLLERGGTVRCTLTIPTATPGTGRVVDRTVTATVIPVDAAPASATDTVTISTTTDVVAALVVDLTTDADGDGTATDVEFAPGPGVDVPVRVAVTNDGPTDGALRLSVRLPDGGTIGVLGHAAPGAVPATCAADGVPVAAGQSVTAGTTVVCDLTLASFSPSVAGPIVVTVLAELLTASDDLAEQLVLATATDDTAVSSVLVLDETVEGGETRGADAGDGSGGDDLDDADDASDVAVPGRLADGGVESVVLVVGGVLLVLLGALALRGSRPSGGGREDAPEGSTGDDR